MLMRERLALPDMLAHARSYSSNFSPLFLLLAFLAERASLNIQRYMECLQQVQRVVDIDQGACEISL